MRTLPFKGEIYELYLRPEYQGLGFGRQLFRGARDQLGAFGYKSHAVRVLSENGPACDFYAAMGGWKVAQSDEKIGDDILEVTLYGWTDRERDTG